MSWVAVGGAAVSVGGSLLGGASKKKAAKRAESAAKRRHEQAVFYGQDYRNRLTREGDALRGALAGRGEEARDVLTGVGDFVRDDIAGVRGVREGAARQLQQLLAGELETTPGYEFIRDESLRGVSRQAAARGANVSGQVLAELQQRGSQLASTEYHNIMGNLNRLLGASGQLTGQATQQYSNLINNAQNMYSALFQAGHLNRAQLIQAGEGGLLGAATGSQPNLADLELARGVSQAETIGNIAGTIGSLVGTLESESDSGGGSSGGGSVSSGINQSAISQAMRDFRLPSN